MNDQMTIQLSSGVEMPTAGIAALDRGTRYYTSTPETLKKYAELVPPVDGQK